MNNTMNDNTLLESVRRWFAPERQASNSRDIQPESNLADYCMQLAQRFLLETGPCFPPGLESLDSDLWQLLSQPLGSEAITQEQGDGIPLSFLKDFQTIIEQSTRVHQPLFIGHMTSALPRYVPAMMYVLGCLNQNVVKLETSGGLTLLEKSMVGVFHQRIFHRPDKLYAEALQDRTVSLGSFCSGGTVGNVSALWAFRKHWRSQNPKSDMASLRIYVSELGHYSLLKALDLLGFEPDQLVRLPAKLMQNPTKALEHRLQQDQDRGEIPFVIVGVAGSTETGSIDALSHLADLAHKFGSYFHVDAAWGGAFCFSDQFTSLFSGIERADSVVIDGHKQLYVPMGCGMVLFRSSEFANAVRFQANYIIREGSYDQGQFTLEGSRPAMSLILYAHLRVLGAKGLGLLFESLRTLAQEFAALIQSNEAFELTSEPTLNILTYRLCPQVPGLNVSKKHRQMLNTLNIRVQKLQRARGVSFVSRTRLKRVWQQDAWDMDVFRVVLANPLTTLEHCRQVIEEQLMLIREDAQARALIDQLNME